jgi:hypothetical protein
VAGDFTGFFLLSRRTSSANSGWLACDLAQSKAGRNRLKIAGLQHIQQLLSYENGRGDLLESPSLTPCLSEHELRAAYSKVRRSDAIARSHRLRLCSCLVQIPEPNMLMRIRPSGALLRTTILTLGTVRLPAFEDTMGRPLSASHSRASFLKLHSPVISPRNICMSRPRGTLSSSTTTMLASTSSMAAFAFIENCPRRVRVDDRTSNAILL